VFAKKLLALQNVNLQLQKYLEKKIEKFFKKVLKIVDTTKNKW